MRLFVGLGLPPDVRMRLGALAGGLEGARWVQPESLHLTLRFIGEVDGGEAEDLAAALADIAAPAFDMRLDGLGYFGTARKIRLLWAGVRDGAQADEGLRHLQAKVEAAAVRSGFGDEGRKFKPHVTIARFRRAAPKSLGVYLESHGGFSTPAFPVLQFTLFESRMGHGGSHYIPLSEYSLTERAA